MIFRYFFRILLSEYITIKLCDDFRLFFVRIQSLPYLRTKLLMIKCVIAIDTNNNLIL